ncbi:UNVERIFIED_CONTAM: hypothetical protein FKN15_016490 [Acipenser sinensis]
MVLGAFSTLGARRPWCPRHLETLCIGAVDTLGAPEPQRLGTSAPSVHRRSLHRYPLCLQCLRASVPQCFNAFGSPRASTPSVLRHSLHRHLRCPRCFDAPEPRHLQCSDIPCINTFGAIGALTPQSLGTSRSLPASVPSVPHSLGASVLKSQLAQVLEYLLRQLALPPAPAPAPPPAPAPVPTPPVPVIVDIWDQDEVRGEEDQDVILIMASWDGDSLEQQETEVHSPSVKLGSSAHGVSLQLPPGSLEDST